MSNSKSKTIALFDFDGTLTSYDSMFVFLKYFKGYWYFLNKILIALPKLLLYKIGLISASAAKQSLLSAFLKGVSISEFNDRCLLFANEKISSMLNESIIGKFHNHINNGATVIIITASVENWIKPWAQQWNVEVLGTKLEVLDGTLTGRLEGKNCNGIEKVNRIKSYINLSNYDNIWAYGDSAGDEPMFRLANYVVHRGKVVKI